MIEFYGRLFGTAERAFFRKSGIVGQKMMILLLVLVLPVILRLYRLMDDWVPVIIYLCMVAIVPVFPYLPHSKKYRHSIIPKRIVIEDGCMICFADKYVESKILTDVKLVYDCGEYYDIVFPFGKISDKFICQKSLLTKGTLEEFEALFEGKIIRKM